MRRVMRLATNFAFVFVVVLETYTFKYKRWVARVVEACDEISN